MTRILNEVLKPEHRQAGFYLEDDEDFLYLKRGELCFTNARTGVSATGYVGTVSEGEVSVHRSALIMSL
jgi:hypothetical protein